jgi:arginase
MMDADLDDGSAHSSWSVMDRTLSIIGAPTSAGAYAPGQERAPAAFRRHGLIEALAQQGGRVIDRGDGRFFRWRPDPERPQAMNLSAVVHAASTLADTVANAMSAGEDVLVLGGDCTIELGVVAGARRGSNRLGLVYIDYDVDLNTPATSDGALDWTGVAHLLAIPGTEPSLTNLGDIAPLLPPEALLYFGADNISEPEAVTMKQLQLSRISGAEIRADLDGACARLVQWAGSFERVLIHFDVDVLMFTEFPIAENVRRCQGLSLDEAFAAIRALVALPNWRALTITEVNPDHAPDERWSFAQLIGRLGEALQTPR